MKRTTELKRTAFARKVPDAAPKIRMRKCALKSCRQPFAPRSMTHKCCGPICAEAYGEQEKANKARRERQEGLQKLKWRADYVREAQTAVNAYVRFRDRDLPCICCGKFAKGDVLTGGKFDAGHYLSRGSHPHLRFDADRNIFRQLKGCNRPGGTTAVAFRLGVIKRIGLAAVEALEADQTPRKWSIEELKAIKAEYVARLKQLKKDAS